MTDQRAYWNKKILAWEQSAYSDAPPAGQLVLERLATPWRRCLRRRLAETEQLVADHVPGKVVADVGCGSGIFLRALLSYHPQHCIGIDIADAAIQAAHAETQRLGICGPCEFICADIRREGSMLARADLVTGIGLLNYLTAAEIAALFTLLRGKQFCFSLSEPRWSVRALLQSAYLRLAACPGSYRYSRAAMDTLLGSAGVQRWHYEDRGISSFVTNVPVAQR